MGWEQQSFLNKVAILSEGFVTSIAGQRRGVVPVLGLEVLQWKAWGVRKVDILVGSI